MPDRLRRRAQARALERPERDRQPLADLADHVLLRHAHFVEDRLARRRGADAELVLELAHAEARAVGLDDERGQAPGLVVGDREDDVEVRDAEVRDPVLGPVDHPLLAVLDGRRLHPRRVRARLGLGQRERRRPLAGRAPRQEALLQLLGAEQLDRQRAELLHHQDQRARGVDLGDLLDRHVQHQRARAGAAVLGRERQAEDVLLGQQLAHVPRVLGLLVDLGRARRDPLARDLADRLAEIQVLLGNRVDVADCLHRR